MSPVRFIAEVPLPTRRATIGLARIVAGVVRASDLVVLAGDIGAGKTYFARALVRALGVSTSVRVASPTFALVHEYLGRVAIRHSDLHRTRNAGEVGDLGLAEDRAKGTVLVVEWGLPFLETLGGDGLVLVIRAQADGIRRCVVSASGSRSYVMACSAAALVSAC